MFGRVEEGRWWVCGYKALVVGRGGEVSGMKALVVGRGGLRGVVVVVGMCHAWFHRNEPAAACGDGSLIDRKHTHASGATIYHSMAFQPLPSRPLCHRNAITATMRFKKAINAPRVGNEPRLEDGRLGGLELRDELAARRRVLSGG